MPPGWVAWARAARGAHSAARAAQHAAALASAQPAPSSRAAAGTARQRSVELTMQIKRLSTPHAVAEMHGRVGHRFDDLNLSAAWFQVHRTTAAWSLERKRGLLEPPASHAPAHDDGAAARPRSRRLEPTEGSVATLAAHVQRRLPHFEPRALSHAAYVCGKLDAQPLLAAIEAPLTSLVDECSPRLLANALWAFAARGVRAPGLFSRAREHLLSTEALGGFNPHDLASVTWSFAAAGVHDDARLYGAIAHAAALSIDRFSPNEISVLAGALATAGAREPALLAQLAGRAEAQLGALEPDALCKLLWAFARLGACEETAPLFDRVLALPAESLGELSGRGLCQLIWAFNAARYLHRAPSGADGPAPSARSSADEREALPSAARAAFPPEAGERADAERREGAGGAGAACHSRLPRAERDAALSCLLELALTRLPALSSDERIFLAWAFAPSALRRVPALLQRVRAAVEPHAAELSPRALTMLGWAHAAAYVPSAELLTRLTEVAASRLDEMRPQGIVTLLWASLLVGGCSRALLERLGAMPTERLDAFLSTQLTMLGWTLCVNRAYPPELMRALLARINALPAAAYHTHARMQLHQLHTALALDVPQLRLAVSPELLSPHLPRADVPTVSSSSHSVLSRALASLRVPHANEQYIRGLAYPVDIVLAESRHVLQVNGPMHYLPHSRTPGPKMRFVRRHIQRAGWRVIDVPYWQLDAHVSADDVRGGRPSESLRAYLRELLARHGAACGGARAHAAPAGRARPAADDAGRAGGARERGADGGGRGGDPRHRAPVLESSPPPAELAAAAEMLSEGGSGYSRRPRR